MSATSTIKKNEKPLAFFSSLTGIIGFLLSITSTVPQQLKFSLYFKLLVAFLLATGCFFTCRLLHDFLNNKSKIRTFINYSFVIGLFLCMILSTLYQSESNLGSAIVNIRNHTVNGTNNGVNGDVIYNKLPQRKLEVSDLNLILASVPYKNLRTRINYPANDNEAMNFADEIFTKLFDLGYTNLSKAVISESKNFFGTERISIQKENLSNSIIEIIINPQE